MGVRIGPESTHGLEPDPRTQNHGSGGRTTLQRSADLDGRSTGGTVRVERDEQ